MNNKIMTVTEVADYLHVSTSCIRHWVWKKQIPYHKTGQLLRFSREEVDNWFDRRRCGE